MGAAGGVAAAVARGMCRTIGIALAVCVFASSGLATAGAADGEGVPVEIIDRQEQYDVRASDAAGLVREMAERGPQHPTGRRAWAYTAWELRARYAVEAGRDGCRLLDPAVVIEVATTLPQWRPGRPASARLRSSWTRMLRKAAEHEAVHRSHGLEAARAAALELAGIAHAPRCANLERRVREAIRRASHDAMRRSRAFDAATDYGRRAGVRLSD